LEGSNLCGKGTGIDGSIAALLVMSKSFSLCPSPTPPEFGFSSYAGPTVCFPNLKVMTIMFFPLAFRLEIAYEGKLLGT